MVATRTSPRPWMSYGSAGLGVAVPGSVGVVLGLVVVIVFLQ